MAGDGGRRPSFIVDSMLGDLAKWLRIMGYDTLYSRHYKDWQLLKMASESSRVLVTRDSGLYWKARRRGIRAVYIASDNIAGKLAEMALKAGVELAAEPSRSRCPECNGRLKLVKDKSLVESRVPPASLGVHEEFYACTRCGKVYWEGAHWRNIRRILSEARVMYEDLRRRSKT